MLSFESWSSPKGGLSSQSVPRIQSLQRGGGGGGGGGAFIMKCTFSSITKYTVTPSLPQPVQFLGWKMHGHACKPYIFRSYNIYFIFSGPIISIFSAMCFNENPLVCQCKKRKQKDLRVWDLALLWVIFKWHHGSEGVNPEAGLWTRGHVFCH